MTRFKQMMMFGFGVCLLAISPSPTFARQPNVIYMMSDELGYYELSLMGHPNLLTPNVDQLAREGIRFTQALAGSSVCAPTRCCLMTGKHAGHTSVRTNGGSAPLRAGEPTVASVLKDAGYATGGFGKWGCGGRGSTGVPEKHGFDLFVGYYDQVHAHSYFPAYIVRNSEELKLKGNQGGRSGETYSHYVIMDEAKKFIRDNKDRPFFCYLPITPPHGMFDIPDSDPSWQLFKDKDWPMDAKKYAAMVHMVDSNLGQIRSLLEELSLTSDTIIFFSGDNGGQDYFRDQEHPRGFHGPNVDPKTGEAFRGSKGNLYEGGLRIPMVVCWPGRITGSQVSDLLWYFPDLMPTVAELAGTGCPDDIDGVSIVPELLGKEAAGHSLAKREYLYFELGRQVAVRTTRWKAIQPGQNRPWELYDLAADVGEQHDLASEEPGTLRQLTQWAADAHVDAEVGVFTEPELNERDRRAKTGTSMQRSLTRIQSLPRDGLIPSKDIQIARVSSESKANGKLASNVLDGDPTTHWHTDFQGTVARHPHELVLDLGKKRIVTGLRYLARQDGGWNGAISDFEVYLGPDLDSTEAPVAKARWKKTKEPQQVEWKATEARYLRLRILSEVNGQPWASIAELGVIGE